VALCLGAGSSLFFASVFDVRHAFSTSAHRFFTIQIAFSSAKIRVDPRQKGLS
jgi:hypothetical protein